MTPISNIPQFWADVESCRRLSPTPEDFSRRLVTSFSVVEKYAVQYAKKPPGRILDLGAGIGVNSIPMLENGGHITVIDNSKPLLTRLYNIYKSMQLPKHNIKSIHGDITYMLEYGEEFDLVMAVDILPLLPPTTLWSTMKKIHTCMKEGLFLLELLRQVIILSPA
jgi:2-polyprenyl-3-methyl-5-hydroxy-6-metoxy-1,4-benzoquinol methylase